GRNIIEMAQYRVRTRYPMNDHPLLGPRDGRLPSSPDLSSVQGWGAGPGGRAAGVLVQHIPCEKSGGQYGNAQEPLPLATAGIPQRCARVGRAGNGLKGG